MANTPFADAIMRLLGSQGPPAVQNDPDPLNVPKLYRGPTPLAIQRQSPEAPTLPDLPPVTPTKQPAQNFPNLNDPSVLQKFLRGYDPNRPDFNNTDVLQKYIQGRIPNPHINKEPRPTEFGSRFGNWLIDHAGDIDPESLKENETAPGNKFNLVGPAPEEGSLPSMRSLRGHPRPKPRQ